MINDWQPPKKRQSHTKTNEGLHEHRSPVITPISSRLKVSSLFPKIQIKFKHFKILL